MNENIEIRNSENETPCMICKNNHDFDIPQHLIHELMHGNIVIFAGAGVSTENENVLHFKLAEDIAYELKLHPGDLPFPDLMEKYVKQPNGRFELIKKIKARFDNINSHPSLTHFATRFHEALSTIPQIDTIITTNWDTYFEDICFATPFIHPEDIAFWDVAERKVLKIHGSINNYGSIIATRSDYKKAIKELSKNMIGSQLKLLMANKTILYIGYSAQDEDFITLQKYIRSQMKDLNKISYIITLENNDISLSRFKKIGLEPIITDGVYFISQLKKLLSEADTMLPDEAYEGAYQLLLEVTEAHLRLYDEFNIQDNPEIIICACYQDGLLDALKRIEKMKGSGHYGYKQRCVNIAKKYDEWRKEKIRKKNYGTAAYIEGYASALWFLAFWGYDEPNSIPATYYTFGSKYMIDSFEEYKSILPEIPNMHKAAYKFTKKVALKYSKYENQKLVIEHLCRL